MVLESTSAAFSIHSWARVRSPIDFTEKRIATDWAGAKPAVVVSEDNRSSVNQVTAASSFTSPGSLSSPMSGFVFGPTFSSDSRLM